MPAALLLVLLVGVPAARGAPAPVVEPSEARVFVDHPEDLRVLSGFDLTLDHGTRRTADGALVQPVIATPEVIAVLRREGFRVELVRARHRRGPPPPGYRDPEAGGAVLRAVADAHPRAGHAILGHSVEGRPIEGVWIGQPPSSSAPVLRVLGAHHGDEWSSFELSLAVLERLAADDGVDPDITALLDTATVWVVPYVNPDGVNQGRRYNAHGVDLNRNYGFEWSANEFNSGPAPFSEPETRAMRDLFFYDPPVTGLSMHSGAVNIGYVWNWTVEPAVERDLLEAMAWDYAAVTTAPDFWVTNGAEWYVTRGDTNDWSYGRYGVLDYTVELTAVKAPPADDIARYVAAHLEASIGFLLRGPDVGGRVVDADSGAPLSARARLLNDAGEPVTAWFTTDPETGAFHRLAPAGAARLQVEAEGWSAWETELPSDGGELPEIALTRDGLSAGRLAPTVVSASEGEPPLVRLPLDHEGPVLLLRQGSAARVATAVAGQVTLDGLAPGAWSVGLPDGAVLPNALLVAGSGEATLDASSLEDPDTLVLQGSGFGAGTRAWALSGEVRAHVPLEVLAEGPDELVLDLAPIEEDLIDVLVLTAGTHLAVADARGTDPDDGIGLGRPRLVRGGSCGCATGAGLAGSAPTLGGSGVSSLGVAGNQSVPLVSVLAWLTLFARRRPS